MNLSTLIRLQSKHQFGRTGLLIPNQVEIYDFENKTVFTHYNDLEFIIKFTDHLLDQGYQENIHFEFTDELYCTRLTLYSGNVVDDYNYFHNEEYHGGPPEPKYDGLLIYFRLIHLTRSSASGISQISDLNILNVLSAAAEQTSISLTPDYEFFSGPSSGLSYDVGMPSSALTITPK